MTTLRDLIDLPAEVKKSDFVVRLTDGVAKPEHLLRDYAITPAIHDSYARALELTRAAVREDKNVAAYIHGSFGSGKSHFMAVLSLMLGNRPEPWQERELHDLRAKHEWIREKKLLRLHFHMVGATSIEEKLFAEYLERVAELHPGAPIPPLFQDQALFDNAEALRARLGDASFFAPMNQGKEAAGWGDMGTVATWDRASFDAARGSRDREQRAALFSALVATQFPAFAQARTAYLGIDEGLAALCRHAKGLGYDGVVLFLDELILWLASRASERAWLNGEIQKMAKLVEAQAPRVIPIVSFVARQRDIAELVGDQFAGVDAENLRTSLQWWEGRFDKITLEDRNLPAIIEKRVVRARDAAAKQVLDDAFTALKRELGAVGADTLRGDIADDKGFRQVYPFSPALVEALVGLSACLQKERTALKVLIELLVEHMEDFELGKIVAVGDLYDVLAGGEEPMDGRMRAQFQAAKRMYENDLLPYLRTQHGTDNRQACQRLRDDHPVSLGCSNCAQAQCRADNRLLKTLLLAALVPNVGVFRGLSASRLVQLNHGTLRSRIKGQEVAIAVTKLRKWAGDLGKLRVGEQQDPSVHIAIDDLDLRPILDGARAADSDGARRKKLQQILFDKLGLDADRSETAMTFPWRGLKRDGTVVFGNVREMDDQRLLTGADDDFRVVIDYPFDEPGHGPAEDSARLAAFAEKRSTWTLVWLPSFFGEAVQKQLGDLVKIEKVLHEERTHLADLRAADRARARLELENLASQKTARIGRALAAAYGIAKADEGDLDEARVADRHFVLLSATGEVRGLAAASLDKALESAIDQLLSEKWPRAVAFSAPVTSGRLTKNLLMLEKVAEADGQRYALARGDDDDLRLAEDLGLVTLTESSATLKLDRLNELDRALRAAGKDTPSVDEVRRQIDPKGLMGLSVEVLDFVVLAFAIGTGRELTRGGVAVRDPVPGKLPNDGVLQQPPMPEMQAWARAIERVGKLFGIAIGGKALRPRNLRAFADKLQDAANKAVHAGARRTGERLATWGDLAPASSPRRLTAERVARLLPQLEGREPSDLADALATFDPAPSSFDAMARHILRAGEMAAALEDELAYKSLAALAGRAEPAAADLLGQVRQLLAQDELNAPLAVGLRRLALAAQELVHVPAPGVTPPEPTPLKPGAFLRHGEARARAAGAPAALDAERAKIEAALTEAGRDAELTMTWQVTKKP